MPPLVYRLDATQPASHRLGVELDLDLDALRAAGSLAGEELLLFLPTWTPGSYLIREYSRQLSRVEASGADGAILPCVKVAKNRFRIATPAGARTVRIRYQVYARELSVRTADVTAEHAYWNHACVLLWPVAARRLAVQLTVQHPPEWRLACALGQLHTPLATPGSVTLMAHDLDEVLDSPILIGDFEQIEWQVAGVTHRIVLDGLGGVRPPETLIADLTRIIERAAAVFGGALPYRDYTFLCLFAAEGHGGLEHAASTTLLMARTALSDAKQYREFLGLAAHEHFHAWNVKRMRPVEFWDYDYENENYSSLLWLVEGWTAYYDDLLCHRAGLLTREDYLAVMAKNVNTMLTGPGRLRLSLAESSFDAWIRLYRPDENTRNSSQNYYGNGAVAALCLDLMIRRTTRGAASLDDVLRRLYDHTFGQGRGYTREDVADAVRSVAGVEVVRAHAALVDGALDPDLAALLGDFGIRVRALENPKPYFGVSFNSGSTTVASVTLDSPADRAGIAPGDECIAVAGLRVDSSNWNDVFAAVARCGVAIEVLLARRGVITRLFVTPGATMPGVAFEILDVATTEQQHLRDLWLVPPTK
ncbi:MAG: M61 family metallopeptidase [Planctomycetes bacterium]|nr:M61 family metallopeptidase [Planctomycetota bacterium]